MKRALGAVVRLVEWWSVALLVLLVAIVVAGVFYRYVLDASLAWYDEFASYLLVWLSFSGAVVVAYHGRHISFDTLATRLDPGGRRALGLVAELLVLAFQGVLAYYGWRALDAMTFDTAVSVPWVRMTWVYAVMPAAGALMFAVSALRLADLLRGRAPQATESGRHGAAE